MSLRCSHTDPDLGTTELGIGKNGMWRLFHHFGTHTLHMYNLKKLAYFGFKRRKLFDEDLIKEFTEEYEWLEENDLHIVGDDSMIKWLGLCTYSIPRPKDQPLILTPHAADLDDLITVENSRIVYCESDGTSFIIVDISLMCPAAFYKNRPISLKRIQLMESWSH